MSLLLVLAWLAPWDVTAQPADDPGALILGRWEGTVEATAVTLVVVGANRQSGGWKLDAWWGLTGRGLGAVDATMEMAGSRPMLSFPVPGNAPVTLTLLDETHMSGTTTFLALSHFGAARAPDQRISLRRVGVPASRRLSPSASGDGADMVHVPVGKFWMGNSREDIEDVIAYCGGSPTPGYCRTVDYEHHELPRHEVVLGAFSVDRHEVTNRLFERFVDATGYRTTAELFGYTFVWQYKDDRWIRPVVQNTTWRSPAGPGSAADAEHPVVHVSWYDAVAYCAWAGKRLPTEAEWEKAARGEEGFRYPWGSRWVATHSQAESRTGTAPVGRHEQGKSPYGAYDMAGNVGEWVHDWYDATYYQNSPGENPTGPVSGVFRVQRGGWWSGGAVPARTTARWRNRPSYTTNLHGFRCARSASP